MWGTQGGADRGEGGREGGGKVRGGRKRDGREGWGKGEKGENGDREQGRGGIVGGADLTAAPLWGRISYIQMGFTTVSLAHRRAKGKGNIKVGQEEAFFEEGGEGTRKGSYTWASFCA